MADGDGGHDSGAWSRIPSWNGDPTTWRSYKKRVELWVEGENLEVGYSLAARLAQRLTGSARVVADQIPTVELRPFRGVEANPQARPPVAGEPADWLRADPKAPMRFVPTAAAAAANVDFVPYFELDDEQMTVYPCYAI